MTTEPARDPQRPSNSVPYELALAKDRNAPSKLTSPLLDRDMHRGHTVDATFERAGDATTVGALDPFQVDSLVHYLTEQANVRRALEAALDRHLDEWHYGELPRGSAVWEQVRVEVVAFQRRIILTRETAGRSRKFFPNVPDDFIERRLAESDTPDTRSKFMVLLAGPWTDGHQRFVYFRDGALQSFTIEG